ncbi:hypothetical protein GOODEAATRI_004060, partial [Goodea atripinnis]
VGHIWSESFGCVSMEGIGPRNGPSTHVWTENGPACGGSEAKQIMSSLIFWAWTWITVSLLLFMPFLDSVVFPPIPPP